jgi:hypothetical protein
VLFNELLQTYDFLDLIKSNGNYVAFKGEDY